MGTPEEMAAERHFTPPTLTEALRDKLSIDALYHEYYNEEETLRDIKDAVKDWLRTAAKPQGLSQEATVKLLITLVDEP